MNLDPTQELVHLNRHGRRSMEAIARKSPQFERNYKAREHMKHLSDQRQEGLSYRIAKVKRDVPAIKAYQKKHPKLRKQFLEENKRLGI